MQRNVGRADDNTESIAKRLQTYHRRRLCTLIVWTFWEIPARPGAPERVPDTEEATGQVENEANEKYQEVKSKD
jgi:hypothetical protein